MIYLLLTWLLAPLLWLRLRCAVRNGRTVYPRHPDRQDRRLRGDDAGLPRLAQSPARHRDRRAAAPGQFTLARQLDSIDRIVTLPEYGFKGWAGKRWLLDQLAEGYDGVLILSPNLTNLLVPFWAGVPKRFRCSPTAGKAAPGWPGLSDPWRATPGGDSCSAKPPCAP